MTVEIKEWLKDAPEEIQKDPVFANFETPAALAAAYREAKTAISRKGVIVPPEGTKDDAPEMVAFRKALGMPDTAEGYELPKDVPGPMLEKAKAEIEEFRKFAHSIGMSKGHFNKVFGYQMTKRLAEAKANDEAATKNRNEAETRLRGIFGPKYDEAIDGIQRMVNTFGENISQEEMDAVVKSPGLMKMFSNVLENMSEASLERMGHSNTGTMTPEDAKTKIEEIKAARAKDPKHALNIPGTKAYTIARKEWDALHVMAYPVKK